MKYLIFKRKCLNSKLNKDENAHRYAVRSEKDRQIGEKERELERKRER